MSLAMNRNEEWSLTGAAPAPVNSRRRHAAAAPGPGPTSKSRARAGVTAASRPGSALILIFLN